MNKPLWLAAAAVALTGCATQSPPLYYWGNYQELIYASYAAPEGVSVEMQVEKLEMDYQQARVKNRRMPPGCHAHLGCLYYQLGKLDAARQSLLTEKAEFPESAVLVDRMMANLRI